MSIIKKKIQRSKQFESTYNAIDRLRTAEFHSKNFERNVA